MSTKTVRCPKKTTKQKEAERLPEWRRICHRYVGESQTSLCGVARRKPGEDHWEDACRARGRSTCVVCDCRWGSACAKPCQCLILVRSRKS